jgi:hypothetical protein
MNWEKEVQLKIFTIIPWYIDLSQQKTDDNLQIEARLYLFSKTSKNQWPSFVFYSYFSPLKA